MEILQLIIIFVLLIKKLYMEKQQEQILLETHKIQYMI
jgi:hypothetical protein